MNLLTWKSACFVLCLLFTLLGGLLKDLRTNQQQTKKYLPVDILIRPKTLQHP